MATGIGTGIMSCSSSNTVMYNKKCSVIEFKIKFYI